MKNQIVNATVNAAKNEERFPANCLLQEIAPLLQEYFIGLFETKKQALRLSFPNGQNFKLTVRECK
jgi:hypothetical protein